MERLSKKYLSKITKNNIVKRIIIVKKHKKYLTMLYGCDRIRLTDIRMKFIRVSNYYARKEKGVEEEIQYGQDRELL